MDVTKLMDTLRLHGAPFIQLIAVGYRELSTDKLASAFNGKVRKVLWACSAHGLRGSHARVLRRTTVPCTLPSST